MDEDTGSQKRGRPRSRQILLAMGKRQVSSGSWLPCPYLVKSTGTGGGPLCSSVRSDHSCPISRVCGLRGQRQAHAHNGGLCEIQSTMSYSFVARCSPILTQSLKGLAVWFESTPICQQLSLQGLLPNVCKLTPRLMRTN